MPRPATGRVEHHEWRDGVTVTWRLRVTWRGRRVRVDLGTNHEGWSRERAQVELDRILERIRRGTWVPPGHEPEPDQDGVEHDETVQVTASRWWQRRRRELAPRTQTDYRWRLDHILRHLGREQTSSLTIRRVDEFRDRLVARGLGPRAVNMVLDVLAQVLDDAVDHELLAANPARGKRRRLKVPRPERPFLEPDMVVDLLDAAGEWERSLPQHQRVGRRAFLAVLVLAGPRISELLEAPLGALDLHAGVLRLGLKTAAGRGRILELSAFLLDELRAYVASIPDHLRTPELPLFHSRTGKPLNASNVRGRLLAGAVARANERRAAEGRLLLPARVTPHTLRRTFASLCFFARRDLRWVMGQLGHADARMTLEVYAQTMTRSRIDEQLVWELMRLPHEPEQTPPRHPSTGQPPAWVWANETANE